MAPWFRWSVVGLYAAGIFYLSHQPQLPMPPGGDKTAHLVVYAVLAFTVAWAWGPRGSHLSRGASAAVLATLYGLSDEWHQSFVPGRTASAADIMADAVGAIVGSAAFVGARRIAIQLYEDRCAPGGAVSNSHGTAAARPPKETS